ncbi:bone morphogenetic protein 1-like isoform X2 [Ptychodera flava]|uniref:bone morphogenetic protein 1-like isoform X2 n=1 Tax=Ptychodera flava TaxID=63121 RepID=UPI00396A3200
MFHFADNVIIEGDISIPVEEYIQHHFLRHELRHRRAVTSLPELKWPNATVPFKINRHLKSYFWTVILNAIAHWEEHTCIRFVNWTTEKDYVEFALGSCGCCSKVGRQGNGRQQVSLSEHCIDFGVIVHEIGHVIGFWHEHSRPDRDDYVKIHRENIKEGFKDIFDIKSTLEINSFGQAYDYKSIMHYPRSSFSKNEKDTIVPLKEDEHIGQRRGLSQGDVIQARELYKCPKPECSKNFTASQGIVKSPYFPYNYPKNHECIWVIYASPDQRIILRFHHFDIEYTEKCSFDYVEIRFGTNSSSPLHDIYCGSEKPEHVVSCDGAMWIKFHSDLTVVASGFNATYSIVPQDLTGGDELSGSGDEIVSSGIDIIAWTTQRSIIFQPSVDQPSSVTAEAQHYTTQAPCEHVTEDTAEGCGGFMNETDGVIVILADAMENRISLHCRWQIQGVDESQIMAHNIYLNIPASANCEQDYLLIYEPLNTGFYNGITNTSITQLQYFKFHGKFCDDVPPSVISSSNQLVLELHIGTPRNGFDIRNVIYLAYTIDLDECALHTDDCQHVCYNTVPGFICSCHSGYELDDDNRTCRLKRVQYSATCTDTLTSTRGMVVLHKQRPLEVIEDCTWDIRVPDGHKIMLYFTSLLLENSETCAAFVEFMEGIKMDSAGRFCGSMLPPMVTLQTSAVRVRFRMEQPNKVLQEQIQPSFVLSYSTFPSEQEKCFYSLKALPEAAVFSSPNYPLNYMPNSMCMMRISVSKGFKVRLEFLDIDIEETEYCAFDYVAVHDGRHRASVRIGQYCGTQVPKQPITSTGKSMVLLLVSDGSHSGRGFRARYQSVPANPRIRNSDMHLEL